MAQILLCIARVIHKPFGPRRDCVTCADIPAVWVMAGMAVTFLAGRAMLYRKLWVPDALATFVQFSRLLYSPQDSDRQTGECVHDQAVGR
jgi:hypothetical protein